MMWPGLLPHASVLQLCIRWIDDLEEVLSSMISSIPERFPAAARIELRCSNGPAERLDACLAALPDQSWPAVEAVRYRTRQPAATAAHIARQCPWLDELSCELDDIKGLAAALEGLAPAADTLEELSLSIEKPVEPGAAVPRAAEALRQLGGLQRLVVGKWEGPGAEQLLALALPALASLSSLEVTALEDSADAQPREIDLRSL